jgi:hypothetical protein
VTATVIATGLRGWFLPLIQPECDLKANLLGLLGSQPDGDLSDDAGRVASHFEPVKELQELDRLLFAHIW